MKSLSAPRLAIVLPCYREVDAVGPAYDTLSRLLNTLVEERQIDPHWCLCFVDDGSDDQTWNVIETLTRRHEKAVGIRLAANAGQQAALLAGLTYLAGKYDCYATMDVDLQDDPQALPRMLEGVEKGFDIAYGVRSERQSDSPFKRMTADLYYRMLRLIGIGVIPHHADYRVFTAAVLPVLLKHPHAHLFLRAVFPRLGFRGCEVPYVRQPRRQGQTKYSVMKMVGLAIDGLTLFSSTPLKVVMVIGGAGAFTSIGLFIWALVLRSREVPAPDGLITLLTILFFGALQTIVLSMIGEYLRRIYLDNRKGPKFVIAETTAQRPRAMESGEQRVDLPWRQGSGS
jgi:polyisoprenyl-phosphate glycosyltransferase